MVNSKILILCSHVLYHTSQRWHVATQMAITEMTVQLCMPVTMQLSRKSMNMTCMCNKNPSATGDAKQPMYHYIHSSSPEDAVELLLLLLLLLSLFLLLLIQADWQSTLLYGPHMMAKPCKSAIAKNAPGKPVAAIVLSQSQSHPTFLSHRGNNAN